MSERCYTSLDHFCMTLQHGLEILRGATSTTRAMPAVAQEAVLPAAQATLAMRLMRVNHAGEVAAQGLYHGQALAASAEHVKQAMWQAAEEEGDHLAWCAKRVADLGGRPSYLTACWYLGSVSIGYLTGKISDSWSLGFIVETERQVEQHLHGHLQRLPAEDLQSLAIIAQMQADEISHAAKAQALGAVSLPKPVAWLMQATAKIMTTTAYWI